MPGVVVGAVPAPPPGYDDLILGLYPEAYWKLDEASGSTAYDSANSHDGTYYTANTKEQTALTPDLSGTSVLFGTDGHVRIPNSVQIQTNAAFTMVALLKVPEITFDATIFHSGNFDFASNRGFRFFIDDPTRKLACDWFIGDWGGQLTSLVALVNETFSVGCRYDGATTVSVFLNGTKENITLPGTPEGASDGGVEFILLGRAQFSGSVIILNELNGTADSIAWFPTALTDEQLDTIFSYTP